MVHNSQEGLVSGLTVSHDLPPDDRAPEAEYWLNLIEKKSFWTLFCTVSLGLMCIKK